MTLVSSRSIDRSTRLPNRSCPIIEHWYASMSFEMLISQEVTFKHKAGNTMSDTSKFVNDV